jgi:hypothetical protein
MSYGVNEVLLASVLGSVVFSIFAAQPLTIVGVTGMLPKSDVDKTGYVCVWLCSNICNYACLYANNLRSNYGIQLHSV